MQDSRREYHVNRNAGQRGHLNRAIIEELTPKTPPTRNHALLARLSTKAQQALRSLAEPVEELDQLLGPILDLLEDVRDHRAT